MQNSFDDGSVDMFLRIGVRGDRVVFISIELKRKQFCCRDLTPWFPLISTLNSNCETDRGREIERCRPDYRAPFFIFDDIKGLSVNYNGEKW